MTTVEAVMKWYLRRILTSILAVAIVFGTGCADTGPYSSYDVLASFYEAAKEQALTDAERQDIFRSWSSQTILGSVKYLKDQDVYEIEFPDMTLEYVEVWGIDMETSRIWPVNSGAYMMAIVLFCRDRNDYRADCQRWFRQLDAWKQGFGE